MTGEQSYDMLRGDSARRRRRAARHQRNHINLTICVDGDDVISVFERIGTFRGKVCSVIVFYVAWFMTLCVLIPTAIAPAEKISKRLTRNRPSTCLQMNGE